MPNLLVCAALENVKQNFYIYMLAEALRSASQPNRNDKQRS